VTVTALPRHGQRIETMRAAVLDLGSNSFHVLVADVEDHTIVPRRRSREMLHLGRTLSTHGGIPPDVHLRAVSTVERLADMARRSGAGQLTAVGTAALRDPRTAALVADLSAAVGATTDNGITLLAGTEEARLSYLGARAAVGLDVEPVLVIDLGGGSLEFAVGRGERTLWSTSLPLGASLLSPGLEDSAPPSAVAALTAHIDDALQEVVGVVKRHDPKAVLLVGGTIRALARVVAAEHARWMPSTVNQSTLTAEDLAAIRDRLFASDLEERSRIASVKERRADHLHVAALIMSRVLDVLGVEAALTSDWGLREGLLLHRHGRPSVGSGPQLQRREVERLRLAFGGDEPHAPHVADLAMRLFDATQNLHALDAEARLLLEHAARLHGIGTALALRRQQEHGAYLIEHAELRGFSPRELAIIMTLVRFHPSRGISRRYEPHAGLGEADRALTSRLLGLLQLADALDATHDQRVHLHTARRRGDVLELVVDLPPDELAVFARSVRDRTRVVSEAFGVDIALSGRAVA
jgi:exopolyphosphatase/guanosine-5'-triphosphate,3'-diphosphate pyrophosphatase